MSNVTAEAIAKGLDGKRMGNGWMACCPAHEDSLPSLSISETKDGKVLVHCHAGCSQGSVIAALRECGLWPMPGAVSEAVGRKADRQVRGELEHDDKRRIARALRFWCEARSALASPVETYLRSRGIAIKPPSTVRFHPSLKHKSGQVLPAMLALVTAGRSNRAIGIHRTWLAQDGLGKAPVSPNKMMLGPCRGGAVRLAPPAVPLMIGEGIETCLAAMQATGHATWAALSTSGMRALELPATVREIIILADGDAPGESAAQAAAARWTCEGRRVRIARPPVGADFADLLVERASPTESGRP